MKKKELERRIVALEAQVRLLGSMAAQIEPFLTRPTTTPHYPYTYPQITCGGSIGPADTTLVAINGGVS